MGKAPANINFKYFSKFSLDFAYGFFGHQAGKERKQSVGNHGRKKSEQIKNFISRGIKAGLGVTFERGNQHHIYPVINRGKADQQSKRPALF